MPNKDPPLRLEWDGPGRTLEPVPERVQTPNEDPTVTVATPAGVEREKDNKGTSTGASGRNWGPGHMLPPWDLRRYTEMALWSALAGAVLSVVVVAAACVVFTLGYAYGLLPLRTRLTAEERASVVHDTRDEVLETMEKEGWHR